MGKSLGARFLWPTVYIVSSISLYVFQSTNCIVYLYTAFYRVLST